MVALVKELPGEDLMKQAGVEMNGAKGSEAKEEEDNEVTPGKNELPFGP